MLGDLEQYYGHLPLSVVIPVGRTFDLSDPTDKDAPIYTFNDAYQSYGLETIDAAISGHALILSNIPRLREMWDGAALFVPPNDTAALTAAVKSLEDDDPLRHALALRARRRAQAFSAEKMATAYTQLYKRLVRTHQARLISLS
jgi:glycosyltransferase involved in cell wall biosynthesis